jgi:hypothetical protein
LTPPSPIIFFGFPQSRLPRQAAARRKGLRHLMWQHTTAEKLENARKRRGARCSPLRTNRRQLFSCSSCSLLVKTC